MHAQDPATYGARLGRRTRSRPRSQPGREVRAGLQAGEGCCPPAAPLVRLRQVRRGALEREHQEVHRAHRCSGQRRVHHLGGRPPQGRARRKPRHRPRHHHGLVRRSAHLSAEARRRQRRGRGPRQAAGRLVRRRAHLRLQQPDEALDRGPRRGHRRVPHIPDELDEGDRFRRVPKSPADLLKLARALKAKGHPVGFALGHAVGDGNNWTHWVLWTFGGKAIEKDNKTIAIAQKPSLDAIVYAQELYAQMVPGVGSWLDPNNNRAFLAGEISLTNNGISIYYAAKKDFPQIAEDIGHSPFPIAPVGRATELANFSQAFIFKHSRFPNAAKEYIRFMLSPDQAAPWVDAMNGYVTPALKQYQDLPVWTKDPKATPFRDGIARMQHNGYAGEPGQQAAAALAEFIVLDMFADATVNGMSAKDAAARAENRLRRIYRG